MFSAFVALASCGGDDPVTPPSPVPPTPQPVGQLTLTAPTNAIKADGTDFCEFTVLNNGAPITENVKLYMVGSTTPLTSMRFTTTTVGTYRFYASCGTAVSPQLSIIALTDIPQLPADANPSSTSFVHRVMALQMTGTSCPNCPYMISAIRKLPATDAAKVLFTNIQCYNPYDPFYSKVAAQIGQAYGTDGVPAVSCDFYKECVGAYRNPQETITALTELIDAEYAKPTSAGISASVIKSGEQLIITAGIKAVAKGKYRVGAWLVEDGLFAKQANSSGIKEDFDTHNNVVRAVAGQTSDYVFTGEIMSELAAGASTTHVLTINMASTWNVENCRVLIFVTAPEAEGSNKYYITNVIKCPVGGKTAFEYK
ncbi:MAG: Omp28-related outer membrane protein [Alistipes sp.]